MLRFALFFVAAAALAGVRVLDDFETAASATQWQPTVKLSQARSTHGQNSAEVTFTGRSSEITTAMPLGDWREYDRLLFEIHSDRKGISMLSLRIYDDKDGPLAHYEARNKVFIQNGWNHIEIRLGSMRSASYDRDLNLDRIRKISLQAERTNFPFTIHLDNIRLVSGSETSETASRLRPEETVVTINDRFFTVRQVARPEDVPEAADVRALRTEAEREADSLSKTIKAAQTQGIETIYDERHLVTADLGLRIRPQLAWFNNDESKRSMFSYVASSCREARHQLEDKIRGTVRLPLVDDTQVGEPLIRPFPKLKGRPIRDWFFVDERGDPMVILSLHSPSQALQRFFATPLQHIESYTVGGGSRWTIEDSPVYAAFQQDPETHRVGWDGWCGHLVRDLDSMGVSKMENTVICLESPRIKRALEEYIKANIPNFNANPELLYNIMAYELMYICYCPRSQQMFRDWLTAKHGSIAQANEKWGTSYGQFSDVTAPPVKNSRPLPETNRGLWYDWTRFNQDRFTDHLLWVRNTIRKIDTATPLAAGGSSSMLSGHAGTSGIDEERIVNEVDDLIIHEGGGSTMGMDLQLAFSETKKPLADPEMSVGSVKYLFPHVLHGKSVAQLWHWPAQPANEFISNTESSLAHGWRFGLSDISELLRTALDVRRLTKEIAAFVDAPAEVAILYSQTATLQLPPEMLTWNTTPYLAEMRKTYEASQMLDAKVTFITERKIRKGWLDRYKLLLIPGVRNIPADVVEQIQSYVARGGQVMITPESLLGDEYNRPAAYLSKLGIEIQETQRPKATGGESLVQAYDQSFSRHVTFVDESSVSLKPAGDFGSTLTTRGVRQKISTDSKAERLFDYPDGSAAVVRIRLGKGAAYYSAASLDRASYSALLDTLFERSGVTRPVRVTAPRQVESRFVQAGSRKLLYVVNFGGQEARLNVKAPEGFFRELRELRSDSTSQGNAISVGPGETRIYEMF